MTANRDNGTVLCLGFKSPGLLRLVACVLNWCDCVPSLRCLWPHLLSHLGPGELTGLSSVLHKPKQTACESRHGTHNQSHPCRELCKRRLMLSRCCVLGSSQTSMCKKVPWVFRDHMPSSWISRCQGAGSLHI